MRINFLIGTRIGVVEAIVGSIESVLTEGVVLEAVLKEVSIVTSLAILDEERNIE